MSWFIGRCVSCFLCLVRSFLMRLPSPQHKYSVPNLRPVPLDTPSPSPEPELRVQTFSLVSPKTATPPIQEPMTSATNLAANPSSSNVRASGSTPFNISKPSLPRFTTPLTTSSGQASMTPKTKVPSQSVTSKSAQPSNAASSSQSAPAKPVDTLKTKPPPPPGALFLGSGKSMVGDNSGWVLLPWFNGYSANDFRLL